MRTFWQDLKYGSRVLWANPASTLVAITTLAVGIAVITTVFSFIDAVLMRPLPGAGKGDRLVTFQGIQPGGEGHNIPWEDFRDLRDSLTLSELAITLMPSGLSIGEGEKAQRVWGEAVSGNYFSVLGLKPFLGRLFEGDEQGDTFGAHPVAVISARLWREIYLSDPAIIGRTLRVNRRTLTIIGVAPPEFRGGFRGLRFDMWVPLTMAPQLDLVSEQVFSNRATRMFNTVAALKPGVKLEQARQEVQELTRRLAELYPDTNRDTGATLLEEIHAEGTLRNLLQGPLKFLMVASLVILLIACVNVSNLLLARATARQKEFSVRLALGASRLRIVRQTLTESLVLASAAAAVGLLLAGWMQHSLAYMSPKMIGLPIDVEIGFDQHSLFFAVLVCVLTALLAGASPAFFVLRSDVNDTLKEGGRGTTSGFRSHRIRALFVVSEVALALVALIGAGLLLRSFQAVSSIDPGFQPSNLLVARIHHPNDYSQEARLQFSRRLRETMQTNPRVEMLGYADGIPLGFGLGPHMTVQVEGYAPAPGEHMMIPRTLISPGYFGVMGIPLLNGRDFTEQDDANAAPSIIINQAFANRFFPGVNPIGRKINAWGKGFTVIGLARDSKYYYLAEPARPFLYVALNQASHPRELICYLRTSGRPEELTSVLRRATAEIEPDAAIEATPLEDYIAGPLFAHRLGANLMSLLGFVSLFLAAAGLYSIMAFSVNERRHEIGVRMALGAGTGNVLTMILRRGMALTLVGLAIGLVVTLAATRLAAELWVHVSPTDPLIFAGAAAFLALTALLACFLPARRAAKLDPLAALRHD
jgi:predicted permease